MDEHSDDPMSPREIVDATLSEESVENLRAIIGAKREAHLFRERLITFLLRYQNYLAGTPTLMRKERRAQLSRLYDRTEKFLSALSELHPEIKSDLQPTLNYKPFEEDGIERVFISFEDGEERINFTEAFLKELEEEDTDHLKDAQVLGSKILNACTVQLEVLEESKGAKKGSSNPSLDQMIIDLAALYETETDHSALSHCYRDDIVEDGYSGKFFVMTKTFLDEFLPEIVSSPVALGKRIERILKGFD